MTPSASPKQFDLLEDVWTCETCHQAIPLEDVILEFEYGFEGEAWGHQFHAEKCQIALSPCCRSLMVNSVGNYLPPDMIDNSGYDF
jgi:hypothetical protein